ncbi:4-oxalocrotonate tautomerase family enzyme [compost metagenome]
MPIVRVEMLTGRTREQKKELVAALTNETARIAKCNPENVQVVISEIERDSWSTGGILEVDR